MKPLQIFLMRHVQSIGNADHSVYANTPDWKIGISEKGVREASVTAHSFAKRSIDDRIATYVSPYQRTTDTFREVEKRLPGMKFLPKFDPRLREQERGNLRIVDRETWDRVEKERDEYGTFFYRFQNGESGADVYDRCSGFIDTLFRDFQKPDFPHTALIITHGYTLRVLLMRWFHSGVAEFHKWKCPKNGQFFQMQLGNDDKYSLSEPYPVKTEVEPLG